MDSLRDQMLRLTYRGAASVLGPVIDDRPPADLHGDPRDEKIDEKEKVRRQKIAHGKIGRAHV